MADYFPVISRAVAGLNPNTGEARRKVYERARAAVVKQLRAIDPPLPEEDIARERMQLEEAIRRIEADQGGAEPQAPKPAAPPTPRPGAPIPSAAAKTPLQQDPKPAAPKQAEPKPRVEAPEASAKQAKRAEAGGQSKQSRPATRADGRPIVQSGGAGRKGDAPKGRSGPLIALAALAVIAVGAGLFAARGQIAALFSGGSSQVAQTEPAKPADEKPADQPATPSGEAKDAAKDEAKSDDRLPQDQAAQDQPAQTPPPAAAEADKPKDEAPAAPAAPADQVARGPDAAEPTPAPADTPSQPGPLVAQRAVLYEEGPNQQSGEALSGAVVWRTESVSGGQSRPLDTALKGEVEIPARNVRATLTIRRNTDATLPASHTIEVQFKLPPDFPNAGVSNVPGILMKSDESARGAAVAGLSVKVTNGFFLIGLSNVESERSVNEQLLRDRSWIDIPILYDNGRRAVLTLEKGTPGKQAFDQAFEAWKSAAAR